MRLVGIHTRAGAGALHEALARQEQTRASACGHHPPPPSSGKDNNTLPPPPAGPTHHGGEPADALPAALGRRVGEGGLQGHGVVHKVAIVHPGPVQAQHAVHLGPAVGDVRLDVPAGPEGGEGGTRVSTTVDCLNCVAGCKSAGCQLPVATPSHQPSSLQEQVGCLVVQNDVEAAVAGASALQVGPALHGGGVGTTAGGVACAWQSGAAAGCSGRRAVAGQCSSSSWRRRATHQEHLLINQHPVGAVLPVLAQLDHQLKAVLVPNLPGARGRGGTSLLYQEVGHTRCKCIRSVQACSLEPPPPAAPCAHGHAVHWRGRGAGGRVVVALRGARARELAQVLQLPAPLLAVPVGADGDVAVSREVACRRVGGCKEGSEGTNEGAGKFNG